MEKREEAGSTRGAAERAGAPTWCQLYCPVGDIANTSSSSFCLRKRGQTFTESFRLGGDTVFEASQGQLSGNLVCFESSRPLSAGSGQPLQRPERRSRVEQKARRRHAMPSSTAAWQEALLSNFGFSWKPSVMFLSRQRWGVWSDFLLPRRGQWWRVRG